MSHHTGDAATMDEFLAEDFARIGDRVLSRCSRLDGSRVYLSGATGFFGKNLLCLLAYLQRRGSRFQVTALSRSPEQFLEQSPWARRLNWVEWCKGDVTDPWPGDGKYDHVLHAATETTAESHRDPIKVFEQILSGTRGAVEFAAAHGVRQLLLCGSGAQYGAIPEQWSAGVPESATIACDPSKPGSAYGEGKRAGELLAAMYAERHGFNVAATRCFAFVGPGLHLDGHFAIGNFIRDALAGDCITLATGGTAVRSYLYGADLAVWLLVMLLETQGIDLVNVGSDLPVRIIDLAQRVRDVVQPSGRVRSGSVDVQGERHWYVPRIDKARALGLDVWTNLDRSISRTAEWYRRIEGHAGRRVAP